jgi:hypothetical protein
LPQIVETLVQGVGGFLPERLQSGLAGQQFVRSGGTLNSGETRDELRGEARSPEHEPAPQAPFRWNQRSEVRGQTMIFTQHNVLLGCGACRNVASKIRRFHHFSPGDLEISGAALA